jgi:hypothetical protein
LATGPVFATGSGGNGGSGVVILRFLGTATVSGSLISSTTTAGAYTVLTLTGGTGTITF